MPSREHNFRVGTLNLEGGSAPLSRIYESLIEQGITGEEGERRGVRRVSYDEKQNILYFIFIKEIENTVTVLDEKNRDSKEIVYPRRAMKVVLGDTGNYVYESVQGVSHTEAVEYVFDRVDIQVDPKRRSNVSRKTMLRFFNNHLHRVKRFKVDEIGKKEPNPGPIPQHIRDIIDEYGDVIDNSEHSVGRAEKDAREDELAYGIAELSDLDTVRGVDEDSRTEELTKSGIYRLRYDEEEVEPEEEAQFLTNRASNIFGDLFDD